MRAIGQPEVQVPHWKQALRVSPPGIFKTSYLNDESILRGRFVSSFRFSLELLTNLFTPTFLGVIDVSSFYRIGDAFIYF